MQLHTFRHLWGVDQPIEQAFALFKQAGYAGIESPMPEPAQAAKFQELLDAHGLQYIAMLFTAGKSAAEHVDSFTRQLERAQTFGPVKITAHSGADAFSVKDAEAFYRKAIELEAACEIPVGHETHRGRCFFNPWTTRDLLLEFESIKLCCDLSHWVCVAERVIDDCMPILELAAQRCIHLHSRVGYAQGPQVPDPAAPEYANDLAAHERWWDMIWRVQDSKRAQVSTVTPEFGPPGYLHTLPHTNVPVADLAKVCDWQADRQRQRFAAGQWRAAPH